jgi:hypothetical protein
MKPTPEQVDRWLTPSPEIENPPWLEVCNYAADFEYCWARDNPNPPCFECHVLRSALRDSEDDRARRVPYGVD